MSYIHIFHCSNLILPLWKTFQNQNQNQNQYRYQYQYQYQYQLLVGNSPVILWWIARATCSTFAAQTPAMLMRPFLSM